MKISLDWLSELVTWDDSPEELARKLTSAGLNVEGIETHQQTYPGVVVAKVIHREKHPDADRLSLCRVDCGADEPVQVVCGAPNVREGLTVLFARVGAVLPGDFKLKKTKIRGIESFGMICSANELQLSSESDGIMELETELPPGTPADDIYGFSDTVLDIEVTPNRPDWLSHIGVAREVAAIYETKVSMPRTWNSNQSGDNLGVRVRIEDYADCSRYMAFGAHNIEIGPSPRKIQNRLRAIGARPINNVVDITNYVMFELGQPMHAFDLSKISGNTITIRRSENKDTVTTLDGQQREIDPDHLLVCDEKGPVALAGVMGLANSEVDEGTKDLLLESAFFRPRLVRTASRGLGLISESSYRFERGADWDMVERAAHRALYLFQEYTGAHIVPDWADRHDPDHKDRDPVPLRIWQVERVLGTTVSADQAAQMLQNLGLNVQPMGNPAASNRSAVNMMVTPPSFRRDIRQEVDLIEEIARMIGYDAMATGGSYQGKGGGLRRDFDRVMHRIRHWATSCGFNEMVTSSFMPAGEIEKLGLAEGDDLLQTLAVINPHHGGDTLLRTSLLPSCLIVARRNLNAGAAVPVRLFQVNRVYLPAGPKRENPHNPDEHMLPAEPTLLQFTIAGNRERGLDNIPADLLELKGTLESLSIQLKMPLELVAEDTVPWLEAGEQWTLRYTDGRIVGAAGRVAAPVLKAFDVDAPVVVGELDLDRLDLTPQPLAFESFARFPAVKRDLSLVVPDGVAYGEIESIIVESGGVHLERMDLFDIYRGKGLPEGHGAYGIRLKFRSVKGNLKGKTVDRAIADILSALSSRLNIDSRS